MWYYFKQTLFLFVYMLFMSFISFAIAALKIPALKVILLILSIALYVFIAVMSSFKEGQQSVSLLNSNDLQRKRIIETGEDIKLKTAGEYRVWKGFFLGFLVTLPLVICLIVHTIIAYTGGGNGAGAVAGMGYALFYIPYSTFLETAVLESAGQYYILLYCVPFMMATCGSPYLLGARKMQAKYDKIQEKHNELYGDKA